MVLNILIVKAAKCTNTASSSEANRNVIKNRMPDLCHCVWQARCSCVGFTL